MATHSSSNAFPGLSPGSIAGSSVSTFPGGIAGAVSIISPAVSCDTKTVTFTSTGLATA